MKKQILAKRYIQALVNSIKSEEEFSDIYGDLSDFFSLLRDHNELRSTLSSRFLPTMKKMQIVEELLAKKPLKKKASRFILLLLEKSRIELLPEILERLPEAWNEQKGISTFEVASVVPLTDDHKKKLEERLSLLEKRPVALKFRIEQDLIGGLWIKRGNIVYDISIKGDLLKIKEKICE